MPDFTRFFGPAAARALFLGVFLVAALAGCNDKETRSLIDDHAANAEKAMGEMKTYSPAKRYNPLVVTDKVWAGSSALRMHRGLPLPSKYEADHGVTLISSEPMDLADIANAIHVQTGIPVRVGDSGGGAGGAAAATSKAATMPISYEGPLSGLLEKTAGYFGVNWRYDGSVISIAKFETRVFVIEALPGTQTVSDGMQDDQGSSGGSGGGGSSGGSSSGTSSITQNSKFSIDFKYWDELDQVLTAMLGGTGTVVSSPSIGTVTITTTPEVMRTVSEYISKENQRLSRQIAINVEIYSVNLSEGTNFNVAFNTLLNRLRNFGVNFSGASGPTAANSFTGGGSLNVAILNPFPFNSADGLNSITTPSGDNVKGIGQVKDIFTALSGIGDTTKVAKFPLVTLNNRPASRRIGEDKTYVQSSTSANTTTGSTSNIGTTVTPGTIHQGFSVQLTPRLLDDGRILLQYSLSVIDVASIASFNSVTGSCDATTGSCAGGGAGSTTIQLPDTLNRIFVQQSVLKSGSMLLLGGAEEEDLTHNSQGVGDPFNYALGGGTSSARSHTMLFFAITPQVLEEPHSEQD